MATQESKTVCELMLDESWTESQLDSPDGINIYTESCVYQSRLYSLNAFNCCQQHTEGLLHVYLKEIEKCNKRIKLADEYRAHLRQELNKLKGKRQILKIRINIYFNLFPVLANLTK